MHYPEKWGFVQFAAEVVGRQEVSFRPIAAEEAKRVLRGIYYRQQRFRRERGYYASSLDSLGMEARVLQHFRWPPVIQVTDHQFEAQLEEAVDLDADGQINRWLIRADSRTWRD